MVHLTPEAALYLRTLRADRQDEASSHILRVAPVDPGELHGLKLSFVEEAVDGDQVSSSQGFYLAVERSLVYELDDKLIDLTPAGESVYVRSG